jgi:hypothetical protein
MAASDWVDSLSTLVETLDRTAKFRLAIAFCVWSGAVWLAAYSAGSAISDHKAGVATNEYAAKLQEAKFTIHDQAETIAQLKAGKAPQSVPQRVPQPAPTEVAVTPSTDTTSHWSVGTILGWGFVLLMAYALYWELLGKRIAVWRFNRKPIDPLTFEQFSEIVLAPRATSVQIDDGIRPFVGKRVEWTAIVADVSVSRSPVGQVVGGRISLKRPKGFGILATCHFRSDFANTLDQLHKEDVVAVTGIVKSRNMLDQCRLVDEQTPPDSAASPADSVDGQSS